MLWNGLGAYKRMGTKSDWKQKQRLFSSTDSALPDLKSRSCHAPTALLLRLPRRGAGGIDFIGCEDLPCHGRSSAQDCVGLVSTEVWEQGHVLKQNKTDQWERPPAAPHSAQRLCEAPPLTVHVPGTQGTLRLLPRLWSGLCSLAPCLLLSSRDRDRTTCVRPSPPAQIPDRRHGWPSVKTLASGRGTGWPSAHAQPSVRTDPASRVRPGPGLSRDATPPGSTAGGLMPPRRCRRVSRCRGGCRDQGRVPAAGLSFH